jgi:hypothetical protein
VPFFSIPFIVSFIETMLTISAGFVTDSQGLKPPVELFAKANVILKSKDPGFF